VQRQESFELPVKVPLENIDAILEILASDQLEITKQSHYKQYDHYFVFDGDDPDASRLRYREDEYVDENDKVYQARSRLTLLGEVHEQEYPNAVMLSRSRYLAPAEQSLRFYREYFAPDQEIKVHKDRRRWRILYKGTDFAINLDNVVKPTLPGYYLEIKARTWSRSDAERKAALITELLEHFGVNPGAAVPKEYIQLAMSHLEE
jgi:5-methylthioadenosine/S-adenosylhomocysteine deaminase